MRTLILATGNPGKLREYRDLLASSGLELVAHDPSVDESGSGYAENARLKAEAATRTTGQPALGDDSGIEVEALDGFPGLLSARLAPTQQERTRELLNRLQGKPRPWPARFVASLALAVPGQATRLFHGEAYGEVVPEWRGTAGFGYDPIFLVPEAGRTFGEMAPEEKAKYSHRARAARELLASGSLADLG